MRNGNRWFLLAALPVALTLSACGDKTGRAGRDDASPGDSPTSDTAVEAAKLTVSPPSVDFGSFDWGTTPAPAVVTVTNTGTGTSGPISVAVTGADISASGCAGETLAPQASCTISITAPTTTAGRFDGAVEVDDGSGHPQRIPVAGVVWRQGMLSISPSPLDLGSVTMGQTVSGTIVLTNTTIADMTGIVVNVTGAGFSRSPAGTCTDILAMDQSCTIVVSYTAGATPGPAKGTVVVSQGGVTKPVAVTATVVSTEPTLSITPPSASILMVDGYPSTPVTFHVTGDLSSAPLTVTITGTNKDDFSFTTDCDGPLASILGNSCQVTVVYNPKAFRATESTATLAVSCGGASANATLTGQLVSGNPPSISGRAMDFGSVVVGNTSPELTFTITNAGGDDIGPVQVSTSAPFAVATDNCTDKVIAAKTTCTFTGVFKPVVGDDGIIQGTFKATLGPQIPWPALLSVTGTAVPQAKLAINPKSLEFGSSAVLQTSPPQTLTVSNTGGAPTGTLKVNMVGTEFAIKSDTCTGTSLTPSGTTKTCTITVTCTPAAQPAEATGSITVTDVVGPAGTVTASLHGLGVLPPTLVLSPSSVCPQGEADDPLCVPSSSTSRFSNMPIGQAAPIMTFVLTNTTDPVNLPDSGELSFNLEGQAAADFAVTSNTCRAVLLSTTDTPSTCSVTVTFTASAAGLRKAVLKVTTSRGASAQATLEGKGLN